MEEPNDVQYLGFKRQDWLLLVCDIIFFYFMLFWPAIKTLVVVRNPKKFVGRWSTYWIGLPSFLVLYYIARLLLKRTILFPFLEVVLGVVCSYNHGSIIQKFAVIVVHNVLFDRCKITSNFRPANRLLGQGVVQFRNTPV